MSATIRTWHDIVGTRDLEKLDSLLADEVVFFSPVVHKAQVGKAIAFRYLSAALSVFFNETFHYVREFTCPHEAVLEFDVDIDGIKVNGVDMIVWNNEGRITEFKVMIRPLKAINLIQERMAEILMNEPFEVEEIEAGSPKAHERFQKWRREHPDGFLINFRGPVGSYLHRADNCTHLGDANWEENAQPGWGSMGNTRKVVSIDKSALIGWADRKGIKLKLCMDCDP